MKSKYLIVAVAVCLFTQGCTSNHQQSEENKQDTTNYASGLMNDTGEAKGENKGIGKFNDIQLTHPLNEKMIAAGKPIYETKCFACHKLTDEKLVGPGWKGVTDRRAPEWIMNFITNTSVMLDSDLIAQKMFVTCLVRMPNQGVTDADARNLLEFMRQNDGKK